MGFLKGAAIAAAALAWVLHSVLTRENYTGDDMSDWAGSLPPWPVFIGISVLSDALIKAGKALQPPPVRARRDGLGFGISCALAAAANLGQYVYVYVYVYMYVYAYVYVYVYMHVYVYVYVYVHVYARLYTHLLSYLCIPLQAYPTSLRATTPRACPSTKSQTRWTRTQVVFFVSWTI
jgi:hypothetical protein